MLNKNPAETLQLLTTEEVARLLAMKAQTLAAWRCTGLQPLAYVKVGRSVRYRRAAVEEYLRTRERGAE